MCCCAAEDQVPFHEEEEHDEMSDDHQHDLERHTEDHMSRSSCRTSGFQNFHGSAKRKQHGWKLLCQTFLVATQLWPLPLFGLTALKAHRASWFVCTCVCGGGVLGDHC